MSLGSDIQRRFCAAVLAALMLTLSVTLPVLAQADLGHEPAVEAEHAPGDCPQAHDHQICTQVGANQAAPGVATRRQAHLQVAASVAPTSFVAPAPSAVAGGHRSRAPPVV